MALTRFQIWSGGWARLRSKNKKMNRTWESLVPLDLYSKQRSSRLVSSWCYSVKRRRYLSLNWRTPPEAQMAKTINAAL